MQKAIISDTSCLILFEKINELEILHKLFGELIITTEIAKEFGLTLPNWIKIKNPSNKNYQTIIEASLDKGEASAIALAIEYRDCLLIIDDLKARKFAVQLGLVITGTFGIIIDAKISGIITSVKPIIEKIRQTNFRISDKIEAIVLDKAKELD